MRLLCLGWFSVVFLWNLASALAQPDSPAAVPPAIEAPPPPSQPAPPPPVYAPPAPPIQQFQPAEVTEQKTIASPSAGTAATTSTLPLTMDEIPVSTGNSRVTLNLFGDTAFSIDSVTPKKPAFVLGPLDLLFWGQFGNLSASAEMAVEPQPNGEVGLDLERMFIRWHTERFFVDAGRTHTELGYWNNAYHHGRWLQMSVERPRGVLFEDEGGILPIHWVGATAHYLAVTGEQQIEIIGAIGNGRGDIVDNIHAKDDTNSFKSLLLKIDFRGFGARDLHLGISGVYDHIAPVTATVRPALPNEMIEELIGNGYLAYRGTDFTGIVEVYDVLHTAAGQRWNTVDAFALAAYRLDAVTPYLLLEVRRGDVATDPFFFPNPLVPSEILGRNIEPTAGLRFDLNTWSALKLEYRGTFTGNSDNRVHRGTLNWSFGL